MKLTDLPMGAPVAITKIRVPPNAAVAPGSWSDWVQGARGNRGSLPVDYELRGYLLDPICVGEPIRVCRTWRNGVKADGAFVSTEVQAIEGTEFVVTQNSVYRVVLQQAFIRKFILEQTNARFSLAGKPLCFVPSKHKYPSMSKPLLISIFSLILCGEFAIAYVKRFPQIL